MVLGCGQAGVGYAPDEDDTMLYGGKGPTLVDDDDGTVLGWPTARVQRCGQALCAHGCARDATKRNVRRVMRRVEAVMRSEDLVGPIARPSKKRAPWRVPLEVGFAVEAPHVWRPPLLPVRVRCPRRAPRVAFRAGPDDFPEWRGKVIVDKRDRELHARGAVVIDAIRGTTAFVPELRHRPVRAHSVSRVLFDVELRTVDAKLERHGWVARNSFRIGPPPPPRRVRVWTEMAASNPKRAAVLVEQKWAFDLDAFGCRHITLTQPDLVGETLTRAIERHENARQRLLRSAVWTAHVRAAIIRTEWTRSTEASRAARSCEDERCRGERKCKFHSQRGEWWHVHTHVAAFGTFFPSTPEVARSHALDEEDSLLLAWRRALVESDEYRAELRGKCAVCSGEREWSSCTRRVVDGHQAQGPHCCSDEVKAAVRSWGHVKRGRRWGVALAGVDFGGVHVNLPPAMRGAVDVRSAVEEVLTYAMKPADIGKMRVGEVVEVIEAMRGRRLIRCTGLFYGVAIEQGDTAPREEVEGITADAGGRFAWTPAGRQIAERDIVWRYDDDAQQLRRAALFVLWEQEHRRGAACSTNTS